MLAEAEVQAPFLEIHENRASPIAEVPASLAPTRVQIEALERHLAAFPQAEVKVVHRFAPGLYMREITVPADVYMTGAVHRFEHVSVMVSGEMDTLVDGVMKRVSGYNPFIAPAGTKRVGHTLTEVVWLTVHLNPDELREPAELEAQLCEPVQAALIGMRP